MSKPLWVVSYWDDASDSLKKVGCRTYEDVMKLSYKIRQRYGRTVTVDMRDKK